MLDTNERGEVAQELADVFIYLVRLSDVLVRSRSSSTGKITP